MNYRARHFEYELSERAIVQGTVKGVMLPEDDNFPGEVSGFRVEGRIYLGENDEQGFPIYGGKMTLEEIKKIEDYAMDILCDEDEQ